MSPLKQGPGSDTIEYRPISVKELLVRMKDGSELIVDLAYSALLHNSEALAEEVLELETRMDSLQLQARMNMLLAARTTTDAQQLAPVLGIISATETVSDVAGDLAQLVLGEQQLPGAIRAALPEATEVLASATLVEDSTYAGRTLGEIDLETETGVRVIGLRGENWVLNPDYETTLTPGDVLLLRGSEQTVSDVYETVTGESYQPPETVDHDIADLQRAVDTIVLMKDVSELSLDLAYGSILFDDSDLATEVHALEVEVDALQSRLEAWTLRAAAEVDDPISLRGLLRLATSTERISDAAFDITEGVRHDIDAHPVIAESVRESDVAIRRVTITAGSSLHGTTVETVRDSYPGVGIIAIHRADDEWVFYPEPDDELGADDVLLVRGTWDATGELLERAGR